MKGVMSQTRLKVDELDYRLKSSKLPTFGFHFIDHLIDRRFVALAVKAF